MTCFTTAPPIQDPVYDNIAFIDDLGRFAIRNPNLLNEYIRLKAENFNELKNQYLQVILSLYSYIIIVKIHFLMVYLSYLRRQ